jgi:hypothetical protein
MYSVESVGGGSRMLCWGCCTALGIHRDRRLRVIGEWLVCGRCGND